MARIFFIILILGIEVSANLLFLKFLEAHRFSYIVIHHTASTKDNYASIKKYQHRRRGWKEPAYHLILSNGSTNIKKGHLQATSRYKNLTKSIASKSARCNRYGLHLVIVGNYHKGKLSKKMKSYLKSSIYLLQKKYYIPQENVILHRDCSSTLCPGKFVKRSMIHNWLKDKSIKLSKKAVEQQLKVIENAFFSLKSIQWYSSYIIIFNLILFVFLYLIFLIIRRESPLRHENKKGESN